MFMCMSRRLVRVCGDCIYDVYANRFMHSCVLCLMNDVCLMSYVCVFACHEGWFVFVDTVYMMCMRIGLSMYVCMYVCIYVCMSAV